MIRKGLLACGASLLLVVLGFGMAVWWQAKPRTQYSKGFSDEAFGQVRLGDDEQSVIAKLGAPLSRRSEAAPERWCFGDWKKSLENSGGLFFASHQFEVDGPACVEFDETGRVVKALRDRDGHLASTTGLDREAVRRTLGDPQRVEHGGIYTTIFFSALDGDDGSYESVAIVIGTGGGVVARSRVFVSD